MRRKGEDVPKLDTANTMARTSLQAASMENQNEAGDAAPTTMPAIARPRAGKVTDAESVMPATFQVREHHTPITAPALAMR
jgi:hypothetical protein